MEKIYAKKSLGQNFLKDSNVLKKIANSFDVCENDLIIEIGPGKGALTKYLLDKKSSLICYELDERLKECLIYFESEKCHIVFDDFLKRDIAQDIQENYQHIYVIANIPYYITTPIIEHILESNIKIDGMTLLVQKEVALRFSAQPKSKDYGFFTVYLNHFFEIEKLFDVPASSFSPVPKVTSAVVKFIRKKEVHSIDMERFKVFLKEAFSQKRKKLKNNLKSYDWNVFKEVLLENHFDEDVRAEEVSYDVFLKMFLKISDRN